MVGEGSAAWAGDVCAYLLTRVATLHGSSPPQLNPGVVSRWIRCHELPWAPNTADLDDEVPWETLGGMTNEASLADFCLTKCAEDLNRRRDALDPVRLATTRHLSEALLRAYGLETKTHAPVGRALADGHVHQGAALPFEVIVQWVVDQLDSATEARGADEMEDVDSVPFRPFRVLVLLRALQDGQKVEGVEAREYITAAGRKLPAWARIDSVRGHGFKSLEQIIELKMRWRHTWSPERWLMALRAEAILFAAVTQRQPGLDRFVTLFERFAAVRRRRVPKVEYFRRSIDTQSARGDVRRLELRLGESIQPGRAAQFALERELFDALRGYKEQIGDDDAPIRVTFPLSLVKSTSPRHSPTEHWEYDPSGIVQLVALVLETMKRHPSVVPFMDGLDVCGYEEGEPNWLFAPAFAWFGSETQSMVNRPACRFHAGEWQWTPLHGLRRISDFLAFELPPGTPRRVGHALALRSSDWRRLGEQPVDELLDDLVWARPRLVAYGVGEASVRALDSLILRLRDKVYAHDAMSRRAGVSDLVEAYKLRFDQRALTSIGFLRTGVHGEPKFLDEPPVPGVGLAAHVLNTHLARRPEVPNVSALSALGVGDGIMAAYELQTQLLLLYETLATDLLDEMRWEGVVVEACPTSNVLTGGVRGYEAHPMRQFMEAGVLTTINTDDPAMFHSTLSDEYHNVRTQVGVREVQLERSRRLAMRVIGGGLIANDGVAVAQGLDAAISSLEAAVRQREGARAAVSTAMHWRFSRGRA